MKIADPDFVCGKKGRFELQPPIEHPPFCVCTLCPKYRQKPAEKQGKPIEELWPLLFIIRARRASPHPNSRAESGAAARANESLHRGSVEVSSLPQKAKRR